MPMNRRAIGTALLAWRRCADGRSARCPAGDVFAATDRIAVQPLIDDFERRYPDYQVDYRESGSVELYEHFLAEGGKGVDVLWSSAMDLQIKLVNDGHALRYESPHVPNLPRWAVWKHEAYGTTYEPVGIAYHGSSLAAHEVPRTHAALAALLRSDTQRFRGRVATYDIERAGIGFLIAAHDAMATPRSLGAGAFARCVPGRPACRYAGMLERGRRPVAAGLQRAGHLCGSLCTAQPRSRRGLPERLHVGVVARRFHRAQRAEPAGCPLVARPPAFAAGPAPAGGRRRAFSVRRTRPGPDRPLAVGQQLGAAARPIALGPARLRISTAASMQRC